MIKKTFGTVAGIFTSATLAIFDVIKYNRVSF
jgi:hypothetical protein